MKAVTALYSQGDDPRGEALGDGLGVHAEGAVFGAGAGRRSAGDLGCPLGLATPWQQEQEPQGG